MRLNGSFIGTTVSPSATAASGVWTLDEAARYQQAGTWPRNLGTLPVTGSTVWFDASSSASTLDATGNPITVDSTAIATWKDLSGNGNDATQSTSGSRPTWRSGANGQGGLPGIAFNGSQFLTIADSASLKISTGMTFFAVVKFTNWSNSSHQTLIEKGPHASGLNYLFGKSSSNVMKFTYNDGSFRDVFESTSYSGGTVANQLSWRVNKSGATKNVDFRSNGSLKSTVTDANSLNYPSTSTTGGRIGINGSGSEAFAGSIYEMVLYPSELSDANISAVESYLKSKWGTP